MSSFSSTIDGFVVNFKQGIDTIRLFINEKIGSINLPSLSTTPPATSTNTSIMESASIIRDKAKSLIIPASDTMSSQGSRMIVLNRQQVATILSKLLGITVSAAISYLFFKWLMNSLDPTFKDKKLAKAKAEYLFKKLGLKKSNLNEYEQLIATNMILPQNIDVSWSDIGGLDHIINDLRETVIYPLKNNTTKYTRSKLIQPPKGVLLFGPPGNAKTMIAKALAKESGANFINLQISTLFDKWYGESQKRTDAIFSLAHKIQPCIIFIDEIDSFLRSRNSVDHECTIMMKTQFMTLWDGLTCNENNRILIIGATNRPQDVDPAILRRMPALFNIGMPNLQQRIKILKIILQNELLTEDVNIEDIAARTEDFSGSDLKELCRCAAMNRFITNIKEKNSQELNTNRTATLTKTDENQNNKNEEDEDNEADIESTKLRDIDFKVGFEKLAVKKLTKTNKLHNIFDYEY